MTCVFLSTVLFYAIRRMEEEPPMSVGIGDAGCEVDLRQLILLIVASTSLLCDVSCHAGFVSLFDFTIKHGIDPVQEQEAYGLPSVHTSGCFAHFRQELPIHSTCCETMAFAGFLILRHFIVVLSLACAAVRAPACFASWRRRGTQNLSLIHI